MTLAPGEGGWTTVRFGWEELGVNPRGITGITIAAAPAPGEFRYRLDELRLLPVGGGSGPPGDGGAGGDPGPSGP
ncbi:MAG: hypothetical protein EA422_13125 [Gemmatimonadales bacterium]|nr:MAG: hypothetical protein EA422_13125 [Gemmatimonadales bacterium]